MSEPKDNAPEPGALPFGAEPQPDEASHDGIEAAEPDAEIVVAERSPETPLARIEATVEEMQATIEAQLRKSQLMIEFKRAMRTQIVANARPSHWIRFGDRVRPDISECLYLRALLGVELRIEPPQRFDYDDEGGHYYVYMCSGEATCGPVHVPSFGTASSRTKFFNKAKGEYVDPREINPSFIARMAWNDAIKCSMKTLFGLDVDPDELPGIAGKPADVAGSFGKGRKDHAADDTPDLAEQRKFIRDRILELAGNDKVLARQFLRFLTSFKGKDGWVKGKEQTNHLTHKQVANLYKWRDRNLTHDKFVEFTANAAAAQEKRGGAAETVSDQHAGG